MAELLRLRLVFDDHGPLLRQQVADLAAGNRRVMSAGIQGWHSEGLPVEATAG